MLVARLVIGALKARAITESIAADTTNDAASSSRMVSTEVNTSSAPAARGPRTAAAAKLAWIRPFAVTSSFESTRLGIAPNSAAAKKIASVDDTNATAYSHQSDR